MGNVQCRQRLLILVPATGGEGTGRRHLVLEPKIVPTEWQPRRGHLRDGVISMKFESPRDEVASVARRQGRTSAAELATGAGSTGTIVKLLPNEQPALSGGLEADAVCQNGSCFNGIARICWKCLLLLSFRW